MNPLAEANKFLDSREDPINLHTAGAKDDKTKLLGGVLGDFGDGLRQVAEIGTFGAKKYTRNGWQTVPEAETRYYDAFWRHILDMGSDLDARDPEHGKRHLAAIAWNALALLTILENEEK